jgi:hypothetical protein
MLHGFYTQFFHALDSMLDHILYQYTPGGQVAFLKEPKEANVELLGVVAKGEGVFEIKAKGDKPFEQDTLLVPIKGSKQMSLKMVVQTVEPLITPVGAWSARCLGPSQREFSLKNIDACCDQCGEDSQLEFIAFSGNDQNDALAAMNLAGWNATFEKQVCPKCVSSDIEKA